MIDWPYGYVLELFRCTWTSIKCKHKLQHGHESASQVSHCDPRTQYCLKCDSEKCARQICCARSVITRLKTYAEDSPVHRNYHHMPAHAAALQQIRKLVSRILTPHVNIALTHFISKLDWQICSTCSVVTRLMTDPKNFPVHLKVGEWCFVHSSDFEMHTWHQVSGSHQIRNWQMIPSPLLHHVQHWTYAIYREIGQPGMCSVAYQLTSSHTGHY